MKDLSPPPSGAASDPHLNGGGPGAMAPTSNGGRRSHDGDARLAVPAPVQERGTGRFDTEEDAGMDPRRMLAMAFRRRWILLPVWAAVMAVGAYLTFTAKPIYEAGASMFISVPAARGGGDDLPIVGDIVDSMQARTIETQVEILKSGAVQQGALKRLKPAERQALAGFSGLSVVPLRNTDIVNLATQAHDPQAASDLANAVCAEYIKQAQEQNRGQVQAATNYVSGQLQSVSTRLNDAQTALKNYKQSHGTVDLTAESQAQIAALGAIEADQRQTETDRAASSAQVAQLRAEAAKTAPTQTIPSAIVRRPSVLAMQQELTNLEVRRVATLQEYTLQSPEVRGIDRQIAQLKGRLSHEAQTEVSGWQRSANPVYQAQLQDIAKAQSQIWAADARIQALKSKAKDARGQLSQLPEREYRLGQLSSDVASQQQIFQMLNEKYQTLRISEEARVSNARIISQAEAPGAPISPRKGRNLMTAALLGLLLAFALAAMVDRLDDRVHSDDEAETASGLPVLAHVPFAAEEAERSLYSGIHQTSPLLEAYRMLRSNIAFSALDEPLRSVTVTSSEPNEGKSLASLNLAVAMALSGKRVILIDCDLRRPTTHRLTNLPNKIGLTSVVTGKRTLQEALQQTSVENLQVLTSGPPPPHPPELLESKAARACINEAIEAADFVIIDTPPALAMADAQIVASMTDGVLLVISCKEAGQRDIARTTDLLAQSGSKMIGTVLNKVPRGLQGYYSGYNYRYYAYLNDEKIAPTDLEASAIEKA